MAPKTAALLGSLLLAAPLASAFVAPAPFGASSIVGRGRGGMEMMAEKSKSLPFLNRPAMLDGSLAGDVGFDPLGLSQVKDVGLDLYWFREAELKHCRLAMLAVAGILFVEAFGPAPGFPTTKSQMDAFWTVYAEKPSLVGAGVVAVIILEIIGGIATTEGRKSGDRAPGDYSFDPLRLGKDPAKLKDLQVKEVRNGRLAMFAAAGLILQGVSTHHGGLENLAGMS